MIRHDIDGAEKGPSAVRSQSPRGLDTCICPFISYITRWTVKLVLIRHALGETFCVGIDRVSDYSL